MREWSESKTLKLEHNSLKAKTEMDLFNFASDAWWMKKKEKESESEVGTSG